jgi:hypothetical protein
VRGSFPYFPLLSLSYSPIFPLLPGPRSESPCKRWPLLSGHVRRWPGESPVLAWDVRCWPFSGRNGRYWARTSDLRLVEAKQGGKGRVARGTQRQATPAKPEQMGSRTYPGIPAISHRGVRQVCAKRAVSRSIVQLC